MITNIYVGFVLDDGAERILTDVRDIPLVGNDWAAVTRETERCAPDGMPRRVIRYTRAEIMTGEASVDGEHAATLERLIELIEEEPPAEERRHAVEALRRAIGWLTASASVNAATGATERQGGPQ